jgi:small subunit ribosomal protein S11
MSKNKKIEKKVRKKDSKNIPVGIAHIKATFNNTFVVITDLKGNVISWSSSGVHGFKGAKKATPHAAQIVTQAAVQAAKDHGMRTVSVQVKGPGGGREAALRALASNGLVVASIRDVTPVAHNGCKPRKRRRV